MCTRRVAPRAGVGTAFYHPHLWAGAKGRNRPVGGGPRPIFAPAESGAYIMFALAKSSLTISHASCGWPGTFVTAK
jgi:hypothetical protein